MEFFLKDGGCTCPGDVAKAIGAGADFVMLGGMLAGHDQSGGQIIEKDGRKRKLFYGMSSSTAMKKHKVVLLWKIDTKSHLFCPCNTISILQFHV